MDIRRVAVPHAHLELTDIVGKTMSRNDRDRIVPGNSRNRETSQSVTWALASAKSSAVSAAAIERARRQG